jgi:hypothetical protein
MADVTLDRIIKDAFSLPAQDQRRLIELLNARIAQAAPNTIEQMAAEQGKSPLDFAKVRNLGSFFPEDENVDDLITMIRSLREDKATRTVD